MADPITVAWIGAGVALGVGVAQAVATVVAPLTPMMVEAVRTSIEDFMKSSTVPKSRFRDDLKSVQRNLSIIKDVLAKLEKNQNQKTGGILPSGVKAWKEDAFGIVRDAEQLLKRLNSKGIEDPQPTNCCGCGESKDARQLKDLKQRLDSIVKHNTTLVVLALANRRCGCFAF